LDRYYTPFTVNFTYKLYNTLKTRFFSIITLVLLFLVSVTTNAQVIQYDTQITFDRGVLKTKKSYTIQVNDPDQRVLGEIIIPHGDDNDFKVLYAEVLNANGETVLKRKKKDIVSRSRRSGSTFYQDGMETELNLYWNAYPYRIKYAYESQTKDYTFLANWTPISETGFTTVLSSLTIDVPIDLDYDVYSSLESEPTTEITDNRKTVTWKSALVQFPEREDFAPIFWQSAPKVVVSPKEFIYGVSGKLDSWQNYGNWFLDLNDGILELTSSEKEKIDALLADVQGKEQKINLLYHYLQDNTTYVNVNMDLGGLKSYPASYVCTNKYGDCKALTTYMMALLNYAGIESNYALVDAGNSFFTDGWIDERVPGPQFNHIILAVPLEKDTLWLENTSTTSPFDYAGTFIQNRPSLWIKRDASYLVRTPALSLSDVLNHSHFDYSLDISGIGTLQISHNFKGDMFENVNYQSKSFTDESIEESLKGIFNSADFDLKKWEIKNENRDQKNVLMVIDGQVKNHIRNVGDLSAIEPPSVDIPDFETPKKRKSDVKLNIPLNEEITSTYNIDQLNTLQLEPSEITIETAYGSYHNSIKLINDQIITQEKFTLNSGTIDLSLYPEFYSFIKEVKGEQKKFAIILHAK